MGPFPSPLWRVESGDALTTRRRVGAEPTVAPRWGPQGFRLARPMNPLPPGSLRAVGALRSPEMPELYCSQQNARFPPGPVAGFRLSLQGHMARSATPRDNVSTKSSVFSTKPTFR